MSAPYHTSGPWVLGREIGGYVDIDAPHALIKWTALARVVIETEAVNGYTRNAEAEANARLIAAAPELLAMLEDVAEGHALHSDITDLIERVKGITP